MRLANSTETLLQWETRHTDFDPGSVEASSTGLTAFSVARGLLAIALVAAPWAFGAVDSWASISLGIIAALVLLSWAAGSAQQGVLKLVWSPLYVPLALFFILGIFQYGARLAIDRWETRSALALLAANLVFFFVGGQLFAAAAAETRHRFGILLVLLTGVLALFSVLQFAAGTPKIYWIFDNDTGFFGPYRNPDHYAGLMEMLIPVAAFYVAAQRKISAALALPVLVVIIAVASMLLSGSRSGLLALSVEIVIAAAIGLWIARAARTGERRTLIAVGATILIVVITTSALLFSWVDTGATAKRLTAVATLGNAWAEWSSFRKSVALDSLLMLRDHPVAGIGLGNFEAIYPQYQSFPTDLVVDYAHNDFAEVIAETGLIGAALIIWALVIFFRLAFRNLGERLKNESKSGSSWIQLGAAVGCCGLLVHSFFDFNLHIPANAAWFAVLAAIATTTVTAQPRDEEELAVSHPRLTVIK